jgi:hypothetical protein
MSLSTNLLLFDKIGILSFYSNTRIGGELPNYSSTHWLSAYHVAHFRFRKVKVTNKLGLKRLSDLGNQHRRTSKQLTISSLF